MIFEITNPSDNYTLESEDFRAACIAVLLLGEGYYGLDEFNGNHYMPILFFGGHNEWLKDQFGLTLEEILESMSRNDWLEIAKCLESAMIGDPKERKMHNDALSLIESEEKRKEFRDKWHDAHRGSMNDISARALRLAERVKKKESDIKKTEDVSPTNGLEKR